MKRIVLALLVLLVVQTHCLAQVYENHTYNYQIQIPSEWTEDKGHFAADIRQDSEYKFYYVNNNPAIFRYFVVSASSGDGNNSYKLNLDECPPEYLDQMKYEINTPLRKSWKKDKPQLNFGTDETYRATNYLFVLFTAHDGTYHKDNWQGLDYMIASTFKNGVGFTIVYIYSGNTDSAKKVFYQILNTIGPQYGRENEIIMGVISK